MVRVRGPRTANSALGTITTSTSDECARASGIGIETTWYVRGAPLAVTGGSATSSARGESDFAVTAKLPEGEKLGCAVVGDDCAPAEMARAHNTTTDMAATDAQREIVTAPSAKE